MNSAYFVRCLNCQIIGNHLTMTSLMMSAVKTDGNVKVNELFGIGDDRCDIEVYLERRQVSKP